MSRWKVGVRLGPWLDSPSQEVGRLGPAPHPHVPLNSMVGAAGSTGAAAMVRLQVRARVQALLAVGCYVMHSACYGERSHLSTGSWCQQRSISARSAGGQDGGIAGRLPFWETCVVG